MTCCTLSSTPDRKASVEASSLPYRIAFARASRSFIRFRPIQLARYLESRGIETPPTFSIMWRKRIDQSLIAAASA
jgi:hypothetical protein